MTGLALADIRGPGLLTAIEIAAYVELMEQENAQRRHAAASGRRGRRR